MMKTTNIIYIGNRLLLLVMVFLTVCLSACDEITDEMYKDMEMVIPEETLDFSAKALKLEEYTLVTVTDIVFHENLKPLDIKVDDMRIYIDGRLLTKLTVPDPYTPQTIEYKLENMDESEHTLRMEYDLSGEGFLPATGFREKILNINDLSHPYLTVDMLTFDDRTFVEVDTLNFYWSDYRDLTIKEARYYINETLVGTDKEAPFFFRGFTDKAEYGEHQFAVRFDVVTPSGLEATHIVQKPVSADTLYNRYINLESINFEGKTYLEVDTLDYPALDRRNLSICEVRYYVDEQLTGTVTDGPFCFVGLIPALTDNEHTLKIVMDVMDEKGDKASSTSVHTFKPHTDTQYFTATALNFDNKCYLQVDDIDTPYHFDILDMTVIEMRFYVDDELIGTDQTAPYSYQGFIPALSNDEHTLKAVYDVKDKTGGKASCIITDTFKPYTDTQYFTASALNFDNKCYLQVDEIDTPYKFDKLGLAISEMRFYVDGKLVGTDKSAPFNYQGFISKLDGTDHLLNVTYDVTDPAGETASQTLTTEVRLVKQTDILYSEAFHFNEKTYIQIDEISLPYSLESMGLKCSEMRFYVNDQQISTVKEKPYGCEKLIDLLSGENHTAKVVYEVTAPDGQTATWTLTNTMNMHANNIYMYPEKPSPENGNIFKMNDLSFSWETYKCQLEITEAKYYIDGQLVKAIDKAPFTFELENPSFTQGLHTLRLEYKVKDTSGTTATWQDDTTFYINKE